MRLIEVKEKLLESTPGLAAWNKKTGTAESGSNQ
jgi:hypothetical protein